MKYASFRVAGSAQYGLVDGSSVRAAPADTLADYPDLKAALTTGALDQIAAACAGGQAISFEEITFEPVVPNPGRIILENLVSGSGVPNDHVYALHPEAKEIAGVPAFPSLADLPEPVDMAVVSVPAASALPTLWAVMAVGAFHGEMTATGPMGLRIRRTSPWGPG